MAIKLTEILKEEMVESYEVVVTVETGLSIGAAGVGAILADKPVVKDGRNRFIIPGSHLKGRLRHECEKLARAMGKPVCESPRSETMCPQLGSRDNPSQAEILRLRIEEDLRSIPCAICRLFGNPRTPSALIVSDLIWDETEYPETIRHHVTINRRRRTAEDERLFFVETSPTGLQLEFHGKLHATRKLNQWEKKLLAAALSQIYALGGGKTGGNGWINIYYEGLV